MRRQIGQVHILDGEDDDLAAIKLWSIISYFAGGCRTLSVVKRLMSETEREILDTEEIVPVKNRFERWYNSLTVVVDVRNTIFLDPELNL